MTFDTSQHAGINFRKVYRRANEILASSPAVSSFPFRAKELVREQSDIAFCSFDKARKCHVDIKQFGSESAVLMELDGAYIIFFNQDEVKYRIRFSIMHEYGHYELGHKMNLKREDPLYGVQEIEANCFAAQILMPEQLLRECAQRGKTLTQDFIIRSFDVSPEAAQKRINTLSKTVYEWRSRRERGEIMKLRTTGYYKEMPHGQETDPRMEEFINQEDPEQAEMICNYLRNGSALIVSPGETIDVLHPEKGFSGTATAYTDGTWVWPGDLAYYVESYLLKIPEEFRQTMIQNKWRNPVADVDFAKESIEINGIQMS